MIGINHPSKLIFQQTSGHVVYNVAKIIIRAEMTKVRDKWKMMRYENLNDNFIYTQTTMHIICTVLLQLRLKKGTICSILTGNRLWFWEFPFFCAETPG